MPDKATTTNYKIKIKMDTQITNRSNKKDENSILSEISDKAKQFRSPKVNNTKDPFNMMIVGATCSGKTYFLLSLLEQEYMGYFDYIILICPTYYNNETYQNWVYNDDKKFYVIDCNQDDVEKFLKDAVEFAEGTNSLIILDDCASGKFVKNRTSELVKLGFSARHYGLSTIVITQQLTSIAKPYRDNMSRLVVFFNPDGDDMYTILKKYFRGVSNEKKDEILNYLNNVKYGRLDIRLRPPMSYKLEC